MSVKKKVFKGIQTVILILIFLITVIIPVSAAGNTNSEGSEKESNLTVYFLDVGEGDAAVLTCDGCTMMIDGGDNSKSSYVYSFLKNHQIDRIDYMVCTHPDEDHIGGLSGALNYASAGVVFCTSEKKDTETYKDFLKYLEKQKNHIIVPDAGDTFSLGSAKVTIVSPERENHADDNTSIMLRVVYGNTSFLFTGDAEEDQENDLLKNRYTLESTVLKIGHHGSNTSTSESFLKKAKPKYAVISVGGDNTYGHPTQQVLDRLKKENVALYRTDMQGMITCVSDGKNVSFQTEKNSSIDTYQDAGGYKNAIEKDRKAAEKEAEEAKKRAETTVVPNGGSDETAPVRQKPIGTEQAVPVGTDYIVNTNTGKFHYPSCRSVKQMKDKNKMAYTGTREELINQGYDPCQNCNP